MAAVRPAAALFDMDGLLLDSEPVWFELERDVFAGLGATRVWTEEDAGLLVGKDMRRAARLLIDAAQATLPGGERVSETPEQVVPRFVTGMRDRVLAGVRWQPGAMALLTHLGQQEVPLALVSSSYRMVVDAALSHLPQGTFTASVAGDEVTNGKPNPEPYLRAAELLGVDPTQCVVLEDSPTGATAGAAAGCGVLVVPDRAAIPADPPWPTRPSLAGLTLQDLTLLLPASPL